MNAFLPAEDVATRPAPVKHKEWHPWKYQARAVQFLKEHGAGALFMDPGLGKTSIVLEAFRQLRLAGQAKRMLVVAPLRVCQLVWRQEGQKWSQFRDLKISLLHGSKKAARLKEHADVYLINPEGVAWLAQQFYGRRDFPFDTVVIDELTKFKNHRAQRSKKLRKKIQGARRRWGLTGTPAPNGYMDLFGQMLMLDDGAALGKYITYFRDQHFIQDYTGFDYKLRPGSAERIEAKIAPYVLRMAAKDYLELPPLTEHPITVQLPPDAVKQYEEMKKEMLLSLPEGVVVAANSGAVYSKLKQLANGAVYLPDGSFAEIHTAKLDALEDLIEELAGQPLLVAYEFQHDLTRLRARLGEDVPTLSGQSDRRITEIVDRWNRGEIPVLLMHPASAGHGLNMQEAAGTGAAHLCWFSKPWDLELYEQTIRRLLRQGSAASRIVNHGLIVPGTLDELVGEVLQEKDTTQGRLLAALNAEIMRDDPAPIAAGSAARTEETGMKKLGFRGKGEDTAAPAAQRTVPKGWGSPATPNVADDEELPPVKSAYEDNEEADSATPAKPKGWGPPAGTAPDEQRSAIRSKLRAPEPEDEEEDDVPASVRALDAFPAEVVAALGEDDDEDTDAPTAALDEDAAWEALSTRTRKALQGAGAFDTPLDAWAAGKAHLIAAVQGFGEKGWAELVDLFGEPEPGLLAVSPENLQKMRETAATETEPAQSDAAPAPAEASEPVAKRVEVAQGQSTRAPIQRPTRAPRPEATERDQPALSGNGHDYPNVQISISVAGVPRESLATLFAELAESFRND